MAKIVGAAAIGLREKALETGPSSLNIRHSEAPQARTLFQSGANRRDNRRRDRLRQCGAPLPADARFCPSCAAPVDRKPEPSEERKLATILFADLVGSTELAGSQDPERTRVLLDRFYDAMAAEIEWAGGTVEKFVGDAVMAAFGAPMAVSFCPSPKKLVRLLTA